MMMLLTEKKIERLLIKYTTGANDIHQTIQQILSLPTGLTIVEECKLHEYEINQYPPMCAKCKNTGEIIESLTLGELVEVVGQVREIPKIIISDRRHYERD